MQQQRYAAPSWSELFTLQRCQGCGRTLWPSAWEWRDRWTDRPFSLWDERWGRMWGDVYEGWLQALRYSWEPAFQQRSKAHRGDGCRYCPPDDCHCQCCVADADLLVQARVGERRVVPLVIENNARRERQIELELSDWTAQSEQPPVEVTGELASPAQFTLKACEEKMVTLIVQALGQENAAADIGQTRLTNVDKCRIFYADLRVKSCDIRPIRIAVALLPNDCAPYTIDCRCGCC